MAARIQEVVFQRLSRSGCDKCSNGVRETKLDFKTTNQMNRAIRDVWCSIDKRNG